MNNDTYPKPQKRMTKKNRDMLIRIVGTSASLIVDFDKIDYERGSMQTKARERVFWTTEGNRVTFSMTSDGGIIASQSAEPDPDLPEIAFPGYDGS